MLHTLVVTCFFQLLLPYYQLENNLAMISALWHEEGMFTLTNATHNIFLLFCVIVCKLWRWMSGKILAEHQFLKYSDQIIWYKYNTF